MAIPFEEERKKKRPWDVDPDDGSIVTVTKSARDHVVQSEKEENSKKKESD